MSLKGHKTECKCCFCSHETRPRSAVLKGLETRKNNGRPWHSASALDKMSGSNNYKWLDEPKKYRTIHARIHKLFGKAHKCENKNCKHTSTVYEWSNKDHKYTLASKDWQMLCRSCHTLYDKEHRLR